jgi:outer membrane lipoprotein-sorting protein
MGSRSSLLLPALLLGLGVGGGGAARAESSELLSGGEVMQRVNARDDGAALRQTVTMELIDKRGAVRTRVMRAFRKYYGADRRTVLFFESPANVKGTGFLTFDYHDPQADDDQWLYLPALHKVRRVSSSDRGGYFLGTDFTYEDMKNGTKVGIADYHWETVGLEDVHGHPCYAVRGTPVSREVAKELGYGRLMVYVDAGIWIPRKLETWDVKDNPLKVVESTEIREVGGIWTAHRVEATNHKTGHRSVFTVSEVDYATNLEDAMFSESRLRQGL